MDEHREQLLVLLHELDRRISFPSSDRESNMPEQFCWFLENSTSGENCKYAQKCLRLFMKRDYSDIRDLAFKVVELIKRIDGNG